MTVSSYLLGFAWSPYLAFSLMYLRRRWWQNPAGVSAFVMAAVVNVVLALAFLRALGFLPSTDVRTVVYTLVALAGFTQLTIFIHAQRTPWPRSERQREKEDAR